MAHVPVLTAELIELLDPEPESRVIDCTFGAGGHATAVSAAAGPSGTLYRLRPRSDRASILRRVATGTARAGPLLPGRLRREPLPYGPRRAQGHPYLHGSGSQQHADRHRRAGLLLQLRRSPRHAHGPGGLPDRRRDPQQLATRFAWAAPSSISARSATPVASRGPSFVDATDPRSPARRSWSTPSKEAIPTPARFGSRNPARRVFQALRIAVNDELESLRRALPEALALLEPGGVLAAISFHSLEDRIVKEFFVAQAHPCTCPPDFPVCVCGRRPTMEIMTTKPVVPGPREIEANPRSSSAKLRAARRL